MRFNPPPNWPTPPAGWTPPPGWQPDPSWGAPPEGWQFWVNDETTQNDPAIQPPGLTVPSPKKHTGRNILIGVGGVIAIFFFIGILGSISRGDRNDSGTGASEQPQDAATQEEVRTEPTPEEDPEEKPAAEEPSVAPVVPGIGTPVRDGKFEFVVTGVERPGNVVGDGFFEETAQGEFVIIKINVTNIGNEAQTLSSYGQTLYNDQGQSFEPSSAIFALEDADKFFLENINPGNTVTGAPLLFDVPPGTVLDRIELHDSAFSGGADVSLR